MQNMENEKSNLPVFVLMTLGKLLETFQIIKDNINVLCLHCDLIRGCPLRHVQMARSCS